MKTSGNKRYTIKYLKHVIKRNIPSLPEDIKPSIKDAIKKYLETDPISSGVSLRNRLKVHRRIKVASNYRIVYCVDAAKHVEGYKWSNSEFTSLRVSVQMHVKPVFLFLYLSSHNVIPVRNAQLYRTLKISA